MKYAWNETFGDVNDFKKKQVANREAYAQKLKYEEFLNKEYSEEELADFKDKIPEWKRTSMQTVEGEKKPGSYRQRLRMKLMEKIDNSDTFKDLRETDNYKEWKKEMSDSGKSYEVFKDNIQHSVESSNNPIFKGTSVVYSKVKEMSKQTTNAVTEMKRRDPDFDYLVLEEDAISIFEIIFTTFYAKDLETLDMMTEDTALGFFKVSFNVWEQKECEPKYPFLWDIDKCYFSHGLMVDGEPTFTFNVVVQEIFCLQALVPDENGVHQIVDGADDRLQQANYTFTLAPNYDADVDLIGHLWKMTALHKVGDATMIV